MRSFIKGKTLLLFLTLLSLTSCDQISNYFHKEFNSERTQNHNKKQKIPSMAPQNEEMQPSRNSQQMQSHQQNRPRPSQQMRQDNFDNQREEDENEHSFPNGQMERERESYAYYQRGNQATLLMAKNMPNHYVLKMRGVGNNILYFNTVHNSPVAGLMHIGRFLQQWQTKPEIASVLVILRNTSGGKQSDQAIPVMLSQPNFNQNEDSIDYLLKPNAPISGDFIGSNLGSVVLLFEDS